jgi:hypothetical protein
MTKKPTLTGNGKKPKLVHDEPVMPAQLPEFDGPKPAGIISPKGFVANRRAYTPPEPTQETLMGQDHGHWVEEFSAYMSLDTGVPMTPFRQGAITRLHWAARFIEFLEKRNTSLQERIAKLEREVVTLSVALGKSEHDLDIALAAVDAHSKAAAGVRLVIDVSRSRTVEITSSQLAETVYDKGLDPPSREVLDTVLEAISRAIGSDPNVQGDQNPPDHPRVPQPADPAGPRPAGGRPPGGSPPAAPDRAPDVPPQPGEDDPGKVP